MRPGQLTYEQAIGVGGRIRKARIERRLSLRSVARACGIDHSFLSRIERNRKGVPRSLLVQLAGVLGVQLHWLEFGTPDAVYVLLRVSESPLFPGVAQTEGVAAIRSRDSAVAWHELAEQAEPEVDYRLFYLPIDDTETLRLFAEERLAGRVPTTEKEAVA